MKKTIYLGIVLVTMLVNVFSITNQFKDVAVNAFTVEIVDEEQKLDQQLILSNLSSKYNVGLINVEYNNGITLYINEIVYELYDLDQSQIYKNTLGPNRINVPVVEPVVVKGWASVEENKKFTTGSTYLLGNEEDISDLSKELDNYNIDSTIMRVPYSNKRIFIALEVMLLFNFIIFIVFLFVDVNKYQKRILLHKLIGGTVIEYIKKDKIQIKKLYWLSILTSSVASIAMILITHNYLWQVLFISIVLSVILTTFCLALYYLMVNVLLNTKKINTLIKGEMFVGKTGELLKGTLFASKTILALVLVMTTVSLTSVVGNVDELFLWNSVRDYYVAESVAPVKYTTRENQEKEYDNIADFKERVLFVKYMEEKYRGAYCYSLGGENNEFNQEDVLASVLIANNNYLKLNNIQIDEEENNPLLYIPEKYKEYEKTITDELNSYFKEIAINDLEYTLNYQVKYYDQGQLYSFEYDENAENDGYYVDPIIYIPGSDAKEYNIYVYAYQELMYYKDHQQEISPLAEYYTEYQYNYINGSDDKELSKFAEYSKHFYMQVKLFIVSIIIIFITLAITLYLFLEVIKTYIRVNRVKFLNKKLAGQSGFEIYKTLYFDEAVYLIINILIGLTALGLIYFVESHSLQWLLVNILVYLAFVIIVQIMYIKLLNKIIFKREAKEIYITIKGEV